jgi:hypothetical protein
MEDIDKLEDILQAGWTGNVNVRHALFLSSKEGLKQVATFRPVGIASGRDGPFIKYVTRVYKKCPAMHLTSGLPT